MRKSLLRPDRVMTILALLVIGVFCAAPLGMLLLYSFLEFDPVNIIGSSATLENYFSLVAEPYSRAVFIRTIGLSLLATLITLVLGYVITFYLKRCRGAERLIITVALMTPILLSDVVLGFAWTLVLTPDTGALATMLQAVGISPDNFNLIGTNTGVLIGLVYLGIGFMVMNMNAAVESIGETEVRAASILGAGPVRRFVSVILPLTKPGIVSGCLVTFAMTSSAFVIPQMLGGGTAPMLAGYIYDLNSYALNWPLGAAASMAMLALSLLTSWGLIKIGVDPAARNKPRRADLSAEAQESAQIKETVS